MNKYVANVRVGMLKLQVVVAADNSLHAQLLLEFYLGLGSLISLPALMNKELNGFIELEEMKGLIKPEKPSSLQQARINALKNEKDTASKALKIERNRQKITRAQRAISQANFET
jgi:hypothetical protein